MTCRPTCRNGPTQFTFVTDGVRQAKAVAGEKDVLIMGGREHCHAGA
jgi:hypothetical protein